MYYAGGDPRLVRCAYGDVRDYIEERRYPLLLLNHFSPTYPIDDALRERLPAAGYQEFTPLLWWKTDSTEAKRVVELARQFDRELERESP